MEGTVSRTFQQHESHSSRQDTRHNSLDPSLPVQDIERRLISPTLLEAMPRHRFGRLPVEGSPLTEQAGGPHYNASSAARSAIHLSLSTHGILSATLHVSTNTRLCLGRLSSTSSARRHESLQAPERKRGYNERMVTACPLIRPERCSVQSANLTLHDRKGGQAAEVNLC
jgi:hypothetical protein